MGCRIGMSVDVPARVRQLQNAGLVPRHATYKVLFTDMTYSDANAYEKAARADCGPLCQGHPGGTFRSGRVWSVYRIDW